MIDSNLGSRQNELLTLLLTHKEASIIQLAKSLNISRTAVQQHISSLEGKGFVGRGEVIKTKGRPVQNYILTKKGLDLFPKQYAWFSTLLLTELRNELDSGQFEALLERLGAKLAQDLRGRLEGLSIAQKIDQTIQMMQELGYEASLGTVLGEGAARINACNCVYHDLARQHEEVCRFDIALLSTLLQRKVEHTECMVRGDKLCSFRITPNEDADDSMDNEIN